ncbi:hypothetical protein WA158_006940 [Blastocystis sp. Blastoise]
MDEKEEIPTKLDIIPVKSGNRYDKWYKEFKNFSSRMPGKSTDQCLMIYTQYLINKHFASSTIRSKLSGIKKMITSKEEIFVNPVSNSLINSAVTNHVKVCPPPKQSKALSKEECIQFINFPVDGLYFLQLKVALIIGIYCGLRRSELYSMKKKNIIIENRQITAHIERNKVDQGGCGFDGIIPNENDGIMIYDHLSTYYNLLPDDPEVHFFLVVSNDGFTSQNVGLKAIGDFPKYIAKYLGLNNYEKYNGHCFRRTMATLLANGNASIHELQVQGRWKSAAVAQHYIDSSMTNRLMISKKTLMQSPKKVQQTQEDVAVSQVADLGKYFSNCTFNNSSITFNIVSNKDIKKSTSFSQEMNVGEKL